MAPNRPQPAPAADVPGPYANSMTVESVIAAVKTRQHSGEEKHTKMWYVTRNNRQDVLQQLAPGTPLLCYKRLGLPPIIRNILGKEVGEVPHTEVPQFQHEVTLATVESVRPSEAGPLGGGIYYRPSLVPLTLDPLPHHFRDEVERAMAAMSEDDSPARINALKAAENRCEVTGLWEKEVGRLELVPVWQYDEPAKAVRLVRLMAVCPAVAAAKAATVMTLETHNLFRAVNQWTLEESVLYYCNYMLKGHEMKHEKWTLDMDSSSVAPHVEVAPDAAREAGAVLLPDNAAENAADIGPRNVKGMNVHTTARAHRIAGVSRYGRQALVQKLRTGHMVLCAREPGDPNTVVVRTLSRQVIGYVPQDFARQYVRPAMMAEVTHVGQVPGVGLWGALIRMRPDLPADLRPAPEDHEQ